MQLLTHTQSSFAFVALTVTRYEPKHVGDAAI